MIEILCKEVVFGTTGYDETVALRYQILRKPLGLNFTAEQLAAEGKDFHLAAYMGNEIVGCLILTSAENSTIKMRQVAIKEGMQGKSIGKKLVKFSEDFAITNGFTKMILNARETAVPFYLKLNYIKEGQPFTEVGLQHYKMYKNLVY